jgi:hypothetical protein
VVQTGAAVNLQRRMCSQLAQELFLCLLELRDVAIEPLSARFLKVLDELFQVNISTTICVQSTHDRADLLRRKPKPEVRERRVQLLGIDRAGVVSVVLDEHLGQHGFPLDQVVYHSVHRARGEGALFRGQRAPLPLRLLHTVRLRRVWTPASIATA